MTARVLDGRHNRAQSLFLCVLMEERSNIGHNWRRVDWDGGIGCHPHRHSPRTRGIQYAAALLLNHKWLGVLDRPVKAGR